VNFARCQGLMVACLALIALNQPFMNGEN